MRELPDCSVDAIVTDPPYGLSFMGKKWDYDVPSVEIWAECLRVLKPGGHLLAFAGTRTQHRMAVRIEDAGFEIRDMIAWVYGSGFPKSHNLKDDWQGWGTALKPALEPITVARKPFPGTVAANVLAHGTGGLNVDGCRVGKESTKRSCNDVGASSSFNMAATGHKRTNGSEAGRWPANLIHDGSEEVVGLFPQTASAGHYTKSLSKPEGSKQIFGSVIGQQTRSNTYAGDNGSAARFFYCAKASKKDRDEGLEGFATKQSVGGGGSIGDYLADVDSASGKFGSEKAPAKNFHPTVKPTDLMRYLCRLITPPDGVILDPFMGSGSTGKAAKLEGFDFIGIELNPEYFAIAEARIDAVQKGLL